MKGFFLGLLVAAIAVGGYLAWKQLQGPAASTEMAVDAAAPTATKKKRKRARGASRAARERGAEQGQTAEARASEPEPDPEPEPMKLSAADLRTVGQGDDLSRPDVVRLDMGEAGETRELTQEDIDERFRAQEGAILDCISSARPDPETYVPGRVTVKFRIQRSGTVRGVRVEGPAILQRGGLYGCVKGVVGRLRFPASGGSQIVSYPFTLS